MDLTLEAQNIYNNFILESCQIWKLPIEEQQKLIQKMFTYVGNHVNYKIDNEQHRAERIMEDELLEVINKIES